MFVNDIIKTKAIYSFTSKEMASLLNKTFEFSIPYSVVNTAINRLDYLSKDSGVYVVSNLEKIHTSNIGNIREEKLATNNGFVESLFNYIEEVKLIQLTDEDKESISHSLFSFLLDEQNGDQYIEYITSFILINENNDVIKRQLNLVREGVILYSGIKFNNNLSDIGWKTQLTIYIETEILFHLAGYNGELYRELVLDLMSYINEINQKSKERLIHLKYFNIAKVEIEAFFTKAKHIVGGSERLNPKVTAMNSIVNGCERESDVLEKKTDFYSLLKRYAIEEDNYNKYFDEENFQYNIISEEILENVSKEIGQDATSYLRPLNFISIRRKERISNNFDNIAHILLSGNSTTIKVAWNDLIKNEGDVPLATYLSFLTNKFWFKLNRGFGEKSLPKSFDIVTKSQLILSKVLNDNVGLKYKELQGEYKAGKLTEDQARARLVDLRIQAKKPEEIKYETINDVLKSITEDSIEKFKEEQELLKIKAEEHEKLNRDLLNELNKKNKVEIKYIDTKKQLLKEKIDLKNNLENQKAPLDRIVKRKIKNIKLLLFSISILYILTIMILIFTLGWETMEKYTYLLSAIAIIYPIYKVIYNRTFDLDKILLKKTQRIESTVYTQFNFDINKFKTINNEIEVLASEIDVIS